MRNGQIAAQRLEASLVEDLVDEAKILVDHHAVAVADRDAGRLLATML